MLLILEKPSITNRLKLVLKSINWSEKKSLSYGLTDLTSKNRRFIIGMNGYRRHGIYGQQDAPLIGSYETASSPAFSMVALMAFLKSSKRIW